MVGATPPGVAMSTLHVLVNASSITTNSSAQTPLWYLLPSARVHIGAADRTIRMLRMSHLLNFVQLGRLFDLPAVSSMALFVSCPRCADVCQSLRHRESRLLHLRGNLGGNS